MEWRQSSLARLQGCGVRYERSEILGDPEPTTPRAIRGSAVHQVAKLALRRKIGKGNEALPSAEEARDLAAADYEKRWSESDVRILDAEEDGGESLAVARARSKDVAVGLAEFHVVSLAPTLRPVHVERKITVRPKDSDLVIHGTIDVVTQPEPSGVFEFPKDTIRDLKTSEKAPNKQAAETSQQLTMYAMIRAAEVGGLPESLALDHLYMTPKLNHKKYVEQVTYRDSADIDALVNRLNAATEAVKRGVFMPADPSSWFCSPKWCGYWSTCIYVRRTKRPTN